MANFVRTGARNFLIFHTSLTSGHCLYSFLATGFLDDDDDAESLTPSESTKRKSEKMFKEITATVTDLYAGKPIPRNAPIHDDVQFVDPFALCYGKAEVLDCFQGLVAMEPEPIRPPKCIKVVKSPFDDTITTVTYLLHQRYLNTFTLRSLLVVDVMRNEVSYEKDQNQKKMYERRITRMQECWNGVPLIDSFLFFVPRRVNGYLSAVVCRTFGIGQQKK